MATRGPLLTIRSDHYDRSQREGREGRTTFEHQCALLDMLGRTDHHHNDQPEPAPPWVAHHLGLAPGAYEVLFPGLAHTKDELERVADLASAAAMEVADAR